MKLSTAILMILGTLAALILLGFASKTFGAAKPEERVVKIIARAFEYLPKETILKKGEPVVLELTSLDLFHGFNAAELGLRADLPPNQTARIRLTPQAAGTFEFHCDNFCGAGHEDMSGKIIVQ
jgi:cytochrome c oxidase subunit II